MQAITISHFLPSKGILRKKKKKNQHSKAENTTAVWEHLLKCNSIDGIYYGIWNMEYGSHWSESCRNGISRVAQECLDNVSRVFEG